MGIIRENGMATSSISNPGDCSQQAPQRVAVAERVFERLATIYGARLADLWRGCDQGAIKDTWGRALSQYSTSEIRRGLQGCLTRPWPPTLPEFLALCRPPIDHEAAYREAVEQIRLRGDGLDRWSHPAIYWTAVRITEHELHSSSWASIKSRWTAALNEELEKGQWPEVPPPRPALVAPGQSFTSREEGARRAAAILAWMRSGRVTDAPR